MAPPIRSEIIWCLTARSWSNLIAFIQIIGGAIGFSVAIILLATQQSKNDYLYYSKIGKGLVGNDLKLFEEATDQAYLVLVLFESLFAVLSNVGSMMGFLLFNGVKQEKLAYLSIWIILTGLLVIVGVASAVTISVVAQTFTAYTLAFIGNIVINIFSMWVVAKHRTELQNLKFPLSNPVRESTLYTAKI